MGVCASRINLPAQNTTLTILNALPLAYAESNVGSMQAGFIMALVGVPVGTARQCWIFAENEGPLARQRAAKRKKA